MEKLIQLHNEYRTTVFGKKIREWEENDLGPIEILTSKNYGFIKRLIEHDKIDTTNRFTLMANVENKENGLGYAHTFEGYEALIMLLSIQDNPIEFLISILK